MGKIRVGGAVQRTSLDLVPDAVRGDRVLLCDGVAISKVAARMHANTDHA